MTFLNRRCYGKNWMFNTKTKKYLRQTALSIIIIIIIEGWVDYSDSELFLLKY